MSNVVRLIDPYTPEPVEKAEPKGFFRGDHVELAAHYVANRGEAVFDHGATFVYEEDRGVWGALDLSAESCAVQAYAGQPYGSQGKPLTMRASDVTGVLKLAHARLAVPGFFANAPAGLAFANGFVEVGPEGVSLAEHDKRHRARFAFPFPYKAEAPRARFEAFLVDLFRDDADRDVKIALLQEFLGACLLGIAPRFQLALVLLGEGANGKSTLLVIVREVMPVGMISAIPPQDFEQEYRRAMLAGKRLNVVSELPEADLLASESFKAIVSGDAVTGRHIREAPFTFAPSAGHVFAANRLPGSSDMTEGFWRRLMVLRFSRAFRGADANPTLAADILAAERPGIAAWMLEGAARLLRQGGYTIPPSAIAEREEWRRQANPVALFLEECTRPATSHESGTIARQLYVAFKAWCEQNGHRGMSSTKFGMRMREVGRGAEKGRAANTYPVVTTMNGGR